MRAPLAALVLLAPAFAGCLSDASGDPPPGEGGVARTLFVLVMERHAANGTAAPPHRGPGGWCPTAWYALDPARLVLYGDEDDPVPAGVVLRDAGAPGQETWEHHELDRLDVGRTGGSAKVRSPYDASRVVFSVVVLGERALVDGAPLDPGESRDLRFEYEVGAGAGATTVTSEFTVTNLGLLEPGRERPAPCD